MEAARLKGLPTLIEKVKFIRQVVGELERYTAERKL